MRTAKKLRPQVESLESLALLSGMGAAVGAHIAPRHVVPPALTTAAPLSGTLRGVYVAHQSNAEGSFSYHLDAAGSLAPIGRASLNGSIGLTGMIAAGSATNPSAGVTGSGTLYVFARRGSLKLQVTTATVTSGMTSAGSGGQLDLTYIVTSATGAYQVEQGETGTIDASLRSYIPSFVQLSNFDVGRLTMTFTTPVATGTTTVATL